MPQIRVLLFIALAPLALGACSLFKTESAWDKAAESRPLEVPPDLDAPPSSNALVVPSASGSTAAPRGESRANTGIDGLHVEDSVASTWSRVGTALERASLGTVDGRDEAAHTYTLGLTVTHSSDEGKGWFKRMVTSEKKTTSTKTVNIGVSPDGAGSRASVSGDRDAVQKVIAALRERLG
jgi:uncharacterized lipoprotein